MAGAEDAAERVAAVRSEIHLRVPRTNKALRCRRLLRIVCEYLSAGNMVDQPSRQVMPV